MEKLINTIFPTKCVFCGQQDTIFCYNCLYECSVVRFGACIVCQGKSVGGETHESCKSFTSPLSLFSCFEYKDGVRECIRRSKYEPKEFATLKVLAPFGVDYAFGAGFAVSDFTVVSVPLSKKREKDRGFNQVDFISKDLAKKLGLKMENSILTRVLDKEAQSKLTKDERKKNMKGVFEVNSKRVENKKILLVDDIYTSGATLLEASKALYIAGAKKVRCFTLARVL